jgi:hypothetical protein
MSLYKKSIIVGAIFLTIAISTIASEVASAGTSKLNNEYVSISAEEISPVVVEEVVTTTTTIDLSWLNTTTTTVYVAPVVVEKAPPVIETSVSSDGSVWDAIAQCESGGNWAINTGNGFGGGLQFMHQRSYSTWLSFGGGEFAPNPWDASREQQIMVAEKVLASSGWGAWPGCSRKLGLR